MKLIVALVGLCAVVCLVDSAAGQVVKHPWAKYKMIPQDADFFPIGVWAQNTRNAAKYKAMGVNYYFGLWSGPTAKQIADLRAQKMGTICAMNDYAKANLLSDPVVWGWMHRDEPDLAHVYPRKLLKGPNGKQIIKKHWPETYKKLDLDNNEYDGWGMGAHPVIDIQADYLKIKQTDASRPVFLQLSKAVALNGKMAGRGDHSGNVDVYPGYIKGSDIVSFDIYPVAYGTPDKLWQPAKGLDQLKRWGAKNKPIMVILEAGFGKQAIANHHQQRAQAWMAINHGATSITWFCHRWGPDGKMISDSMPLANAEVGKAVKAINEEIHSLAAVINYPALNGAAKATGAELDLGVRRHGGAVYVFAVERGNKGGEATITVPMQGEGTVHVIGEDRTLNYAKGKFTDTFKAFDTHLYKITR